MTSDIVGSVCSKCYDGRSPRGRDKDVINGGHDVDHNEPRCAAWWPRWRQQGGKTMMSARWTWSKIGQLHPQHKESLPWPMTPDASHSHSPYVKKIFDFVIRRMYQRCPQWDSRQLLLASEHVSSSRSFLRAILKHTIYGRNMDATEQRDLTCSCR